MLKVYTTTGDIKVVEQPITDISKTEETLNFIADQLQEILDILKLITS